MLFTLYGYQNMYIFFQNNVYYHIYHCHLDVRWFQLSLLSELPKSRDNLKCCLYTALSDLVQLSRNQFKKVNCLLLNIFIVIIVYFYFNVFTRYLHNMH